jgi:S1-C subfamily serine protease
VRRIRSGIGVLVEDVVPGSPAARAGIRSADILRKLGSLTVRGGDDVYNFADRYKPGQTIQARILRGGREQTVSLNLAENRSRE